MNAQDAERLWAIAPHEAADESFGELAQSVLDELRGLLGLMDYDFNLDVSLQDRDFVWYLAKPQEQRIDSVAVTVLGGGNRTLDDADQPTMGISATVLLHHGGEHLCSRERRNSILYTFERQADRSAKWRCHGWQVDEFDEFWSEGPGRAYQPTVQ